MKSASRAFGGLSAFLVLTGLMGVMTLSSGCDSSGSQSDVRPHRPRRETRPPLGHQRPASASKHQYKAGPGLAVPPHRTVSLGESVEGRPLTLEIFGDGPDRVFIFGGIHGDEPTSATLAKRFADHLRIHWEMFEGKTIGILAEANPDGLLRKTRTNAHGIDLNRNFPASNWSKAGKSGKHGTRPCSEPETRAIIKAMELIQPARIVAIHSARGGRHCNNYDGPARLLAEAMNQHNRYPVKASMGYPTPGSFGTYAGIDHCIPTITLELPRADSALSVWRDNAVALESFIGGVPVVAR